jgi:hypothetical protein
MVVGFIITYAIMPITTNILSSNPTCREVYSIQQYVIKFVSDWKLFETTVLKEMHGFLVMLPPFGPHNNLAVRENDGITRDV